YRPLAIFLSVIVILGVAAAVISADEYRGKVVETIFVTVFFGTFLLFFGTILHEMGHALCARMVGWRVFSITLGYGWLLCRFWWNGTSVEIRGLPLGGHVVVAPRDPGWYRCKSLLVTSAGPGANLAAFALIFFLLPAGGFGAWASYLLFFGAWPTYLLFL